MATEAARSHHGFAPPIAGALLTLFTFVPRSGAPLRGALFAAQKWTAIQRHVRSARDSPAGIFVSRREESRRDAPCPLVSLDSYEDGSDPFGRENGQGQEERSEEGEDRSGRAFAPWGRPSSLKPGPSRAPAPAQFAMATPHCSVVGLKRSVEVAGTCPMRVAQVTGPVVPSPTSPADPVMVDPFAATAFDPMRTSSP